MEWICCEDIRGWKWDRREGETVLGEGRNTVGETTQKLGSIEWLALLAAFVIVVAMRFVGVFFHFIVN